MWHVEVLDSVAAHKASTSTQYQHRFPKAPLNPSDEEWDTWAKACSAEMGRAKAEQKAAQKAPEQKHIAHQVQKMQSGYMRNQKRTHKRILGKGSTNTLGAVRDCDTKELHTDPNKITDAVKSSISA